MTQGSARPLGGKVAWVTGGVRGMGRAIARRLAQDGAAVIIHARVSEAEGRAVAAEVAGHGAESLLCLAEVTDEAAVRAMVEQCGERFGRLDILVNNAAIRGQVPFLGMSLAEWREVTGVILDGAFIVTKACLPLMLQSGEGGQIVNIGGAPPYTGALERAHGVTPEGGPGGLTPPPGAPVSHPAVTFNYARPRPA